MRTIGLTGGPGVGKSEVARILKENKAIIISGDEIGKEVVEKNPSVLKKLVRTFGDEILLPNKKLNRKFLGSLVFADRQKMVKLNNIVHPQLLKIIKQRIAENRMRYPRRLIIIDAALIFEWGIANWFDYILVVTAKRDIRITRMVKNGLTFRQSADRISSQIPQKTKVSLADFIIENNSTKSVLNRKVKSFLTALKSASSNV